MNRGRAVVAPLLSVVGAGLLAFGLLYHSTAVSSKSPAPAVVPMPELEGLPDPMPAAPVAAQTQPMSEPVMTQEVARGGVTRDVSGQITKTYEEGKQAPKACPT